MYPVTWIDHTGWDLYKQLPLYNKKICIVANNLLYEFSPDTDMRIFLYSEPPEIIYGIDEYCRVHYRAYDYILTWDESILNDIPNARELIYIDPWITDEFVENKKEFKVTFLRGNKNYAPGHKLRLFVFMEDDKITIPHEFYSTMDFDRHKREINLFSDSQYNIAIENSVHNNYFTEKILDCFLTKTIPVYYGCPNIGKWFDSNGIIRVYSIDNLCKKINSLDENYYEEHYSSVEKNFEIAREICKDLGTGGYKILDRKLNELIEEKYGYN